MFKQKRAEGYKGEGRGRVENGRFGISININSLQLCPLWDLLCIERGYQGVLASCSYLHERAAHSLPSANLGRSDLTPPLFNSLIPQIRSKIHRGEEMSYRVHARSTFWGKTSGKPT